VRLNKAKCQFLKLEMTYLGHTVSANEIQPIQMWNNQYRSIFNSVDNNNNCNMLCNEYKSSETVFTNDMFILSIEVRDVFKSLSCGKSPGLDRIS